MSTQPPRACRRPVSLPVRFAAAVTALTAAALLAATLPAEAQQARTGQAPPLTASAANATAANGKISRIKTIPTSAAEIPNLLRGQYRWMGYDSQPEGWPGGDTYYRDQVYWGRIEPSDNQFDFSFLDAGLADAEAHGGKFNFRVMSYCPSCWMNFRDDWPAVTPGFIPTQSGTDVPDWNDPAFVSQWEELMTELGRRYGRDERIGIVDVGGYGKYGEYWTDADEGKITLANSQRIVGAVVKAFPKAHVVLNTMDPNLVVPAVRKYKTLGLRTDCLGAFNMYSIIPTTPALQQVWKRAPVISEWCHQPTATATEGLKQVRAYHVSMVSSGNQWTPYVDMTPAEQKAWTATSKAAGYRYALTNFTAPKVLHRGSKVSVDSIWRNAGSAPTYDHWQPRLGLRNRAGEVVWQTRWSVPLQRLLPGTHRNSTTVRIPAEIKKGTYTLVVQVANPSARYQPMNLANRSRDTNGWYPITGATVK